MKETKRFLGESERDTDLMGLMEENRLCTKLLKLMNDALEIMLRRKRDLLLTVSVGVTGPIKPKYSPQKVDKIKQHEIDSNNKLIEVLTADLERISGAKATLDNPGYA